MCGLVGFYLDGEPESLSTQLNLCLASIQHRGKDFQGKYISHPFYSAHSRLQIIDLDNRSNQPFLYKQYTVLFNGEIYNYKELKNELIQLGYSFNTLSDTEVIAIGFRQWSIRLFEKLDGMFSIVIYDSISSQIILARDIFGKKPLYYSDKKGFSFCSELEAFKILLPDINISNEAINQFLSIGYTLHPTTIYEDVFLLPPSSYLIYDIPKGKYEIIEYYQIENDFANKNNDSLPDIIDNVSKLLEQSVLKRLTGDVPWGIFLSSGLDSCGIAAICAQTLKKKPPCFTISFPDTKYDESFVAKELTSIFQLPHYLTNLSYVDTHKFHSYLNTIDYSTFDNSSFPIYCLSESASSKVGFVLTGDGGDEIFGGYSTYKADILNMQLRTIIPLLKQLKILSIIEKITHNKNDKIGLLTKANRLSKGLDTNYQKAHYQWRLIFSAEQRVKILGENFRELIFDTDPFFNFQKKYEKAKDLDLKNQHQYVDIKTWMTDNNLIKLDRNTMAHSLEARSPFLDRVLFKYIASCHVKYINDKQLLRKALHSLLPTSILNQKKVGFNSPVHQWFGIKENEFEFYTHYLYSLLYKK